MKYRFLCSLALVLGAVSSQVQATSPSPGDADYVVNTKAHVGAYNLVLQGDLTTNSDIEGRAFIGGNIAMPGSVLEVGTHLPANPNVDAVSIIGDVDASIVRVFNNNNIVYGGDKNSTSFEGGIATQQSQASLQTAFNEIWNQAINDSAHFKTLSSTGNVAITQEGKKGTFENSNALDLNVFNIDASTFLTNQNGVYDLSVSPSTPIVINVGGAGDINIKAGAQGNLANFASGQNILWNFYDATSIQFNGGSWFGSVLAPKADLTLGGGNINGGVLAKSLTANSELHNALFTYMPPEKPPTEDVPAPAGILLLGLGLLIMALRKSRKVNF